MKKITTISVALALAVATAIPSSAATVSWGLDRIGAPTDAGAGVKVYVLDTGVADDPGFSGRLYKDIGDCNGHGTHIAGTIASTQFGIARTADIVSVRVANCDGGVNPATLIKGIEWVIANHRAGTPGVANLSVAVNPDPKVDAAIESLYRAGILPVVAAGNQSMDACKLSPARVVNALTVAGTNMNDYRTTNSNYGSCVDIFAPGGLIKSEDAKSPTGTSTRVGTSMAAAHVTGIAAVYLSANPKAKPAEVAYAITNGALRGVVINPKDSPNLLAQVVVGIGAVASNALVYTETVQKATPVKATRLNVVNRHLTWNGAVGVEYQVQKSRNGKTWTPLAVSSNLTTPLPGAGYYRVILGTLVSTTIKWG